MPLNPDFKAKLVAALRSGEYSQCKGRLRDATGFCCLGVATDLAIKEGLVKGHWEERSSKVDDAPGYSYVNDAICYGGYLPPDVRTALEFGERGPYNLNFPGNPALKTLVNGCFTLADLNDSGYTFAQIADIIEEQF